MKKNVLFMGICLCCISSFIQAQEKEVFPVRDAEWTVCCDVSVFDGFYWDEYHVNDYKISLIGCDTVWNQENYHIFTECALYHIFTQRDLRGGFRTDGERVWITFDFEHEYLLYDFDVNVGDTICHGMIYKEMPFYEVSYPIESRRKFEVISVIDKIEYELEEKKLYVSTFVWDALSYIPWMYMGPDVWQEGIGSLKGLYMSWAGMGPEATGGHSLYSYYTRVVKREGEIVYFDSTIPKYPDVPDIRGLNELETSALQVYYDESLKKLSIHSEDADWTGTFSLYDLSGNRLYQTSVCSRVQVPLDSYPDGYYLCEIVCGNRVVYSSKIRL